MTETLQLFVTQIFIFILATLGYLKFFQNAYKKNDLLYSINVCYFNKLLHQNAIQILVKIL